MKHRAAFVIVALLTTLTAMLPASLAVAAADDPATVVQRFLDTRNRYDVEGTLALVTDDFRLVSGPQCTAASPCLGPAGLRTEMANYIRAHAQVTMVGVPQVSGTTVQFRTEARSDVYPPAGVERIVSNATVEVRDGKVAGYLGIPDASDAQTAQYLAYQRAAQGSPSAPQAGGGGAVAYIRRLGDG